MPPGAGGARRGPGKADRDMDLRLPCGRNGRTPELQRRGVAENLARSQTQQIGAAERMRRIRQHACERDSSERMRNVRRAESAIAEPGLGRAKRLATQPGGKGVGMPHPATLATCGGRRSASPPRGGVVRFPTFGGGDDGKRTTRGAAHSHAAHAAHAATARIPWGREPGRRGAPRSALQVGEVLEHLVGGRDDAGVRLESALGDD